MDQQERYEAWQTTRTMLDAAEIDSREIRAGVLLMACQQGCGTNLRRLRAATNIPVGDINKISYYLRRGGIWDGTTFWAPWLDSNPDGSDAEVGVARMSFVLAIMVATGDISSKWADGEMTFHSRTVGQVLNLGDDILGDAKDTPWRNIVPRKPIMRMGDEANAPVPWWVLGRRIPWGSRSA